MADVLFELQTQLTHSVVTAEMIECIRDEISLPLTGFARVCVRTLKAIHPPRAIYNGNYIAYYGVALNNSIARTNNLQSSTTF